MWHKIVRKNGGTDWGCSGIGRGGGASARVRELSSGRMGSSPRPLTARKRSLPVASFPLLYSICSSSRTIASCLKTPITCYRAWLAVPSCMVSFSSLSLASTRHVDACAGRYASARTWSTDQSSMRVLCMCRHNVDPPPRLTPSPADGQALSFKRSTTVCKTVDDLADGVFMVQFMVDMCVTCAVFVCVCVWGGGGCRGIDKRVRR